MRMEVMEMLVMMMEMMVMERIVMMMEVMERIVMMEVMERIVMMMEVMRMMMEVMRMEMMMVMMMEVIMMEVMRMMMEVMRMMMEVMRMEVIMRMMTAVLCNSASGSVRITDVQLQGMLVRLGNSSQREQDIGGFRLQQNVAGRPIAEFLFPPRTLLQPASSVTVWSEASGRKTQSPGDFLWVGLERIMLRPECTTVLCKDNGQAIAWYTPARCTGIKPQKAWAEHHEKVESCREDTLSFEEASIPATEINCPDNTPFLLIKRKKHVFRVCHSPWTQNPSSITHPSCSPCALLDFRAQPQSNPARKLTAGVQARRPATLRSQGTGVGGGPVRSAGPCVGGMMFLGSQPPCTSLLQQYRTAAKLHSHNMVITA
ncbi:lamin tail domain-containing protein 1-like isoform X3 [Oncorhynchus keta]|uniref:lamin tail domain-containing protein 1-like isoform X3 n=1 Tax=Oncorhynchus keta TaxID=8018 RepID=UPI00227CA8DD|nr:lamin tail domain-containing protein 1-like isoform X3 [Oncorhynchus keta]